MVGEELKRYRIASCYTRQALGEALGFHDRMAENMVYRWEAGMRPVPIKYFRELNRLIHIPFEKLIP